MIVSNKAKTVAGLAPETWLGETDMDEAVVRIPTAVLASFAEEAGISLPPCWDDPATRYASKVPDYRIRRKAGVA